MLIATPPPTTAPPAPTLPRARPGRTRRIDPLGFGALLFAAIGFLAVLVLWRPGPLTPTRASLEVSVPAVSVNLHDSGQLEMSAPFVSVDTHHPVDKHDDASQALDARALSGGSVIQPDVHHPVDRHDDHP
jgi:hypothetical protein